MDDPAQANRYVAFQDQKLVAAGELTEVTVALRRRIDEGDPAMVLVFDAADGRPVEVDLSAAAAGSPTAGDTTPPARGRPRLGVVGCEVTLLPRHWEWLQRQRGGPSATLRRLVDEARRVHRDRNRVREAQDAIHRFISATAGDLPGYEEATRALYRGNRERFASETAGWPRDVREQVRTWEEAAFAAVEAD